uniref:Tubulin polyglutamylase TTLL4 n=1 Tax=Plectus sambesii TaxID=2011161 RepID=A0A914XU25_9BILA
MDSAASSKDCKRKVGKQLLQEQPSTSSTPDEDDEDDYAIDGGDDSTNDYSDSEAETDASVPADSSSNNKRRVSFQSDCDLPGAVSKRLDLGSASAFFNGLTVSPREQRSSSLKAKTRSFSPWRLVSKCFYGSSDSLPLLATDRSVLEKSPSLRRPLDFDYLPNFCRNRPEAIVSDEKQPFLRPSRFSHVPPTIRFYLYGEKVEKPKRAIRRMLRWCHNSLIPKVVRKCLATSHFYIVEEKLFWIGYWGRHLKSSSYRHILPYQKVNHFAGAFHIGRKDRLWGHINRMSIKWGSDHFNLMPFTYVLPKDSRHLKGVLTGPNATYLILKPPASARGAGIKIVHRYQQVPKKTPLIAQHYVDRPFLINGAKFDLRLYVYITSLNPLRIYLYEDGLVRFASLRYSNALSSLSNRFMHLTNYSINKTAHENGASDRPVDKWTLAKLWRYLEERGLDGNKLTQQIVDLILKAIIGCEASMTHHMQQYAACPFTSHELFGFDILLDESLKPWLLEVNISPSLQSGTELDRAVKGPLARDVLNLSGMNIPDKQQISVARLIPHSLPVPSSEESLDYRVKPLEALVTEREKAKREAHVAHFLQTGSVLPSILHDLTSDDVRLLVDMEDEWDRRGRFTRIFPSPGTTRYLKYFDIPKYANLLLDEWMSHYFYMRDSGCRRLESLCRNKFHFAQSPDSTFSDA